MPRLAAARGKRRRDADEARDAHSMRHDQIARPRDENDGAKRKDAPDEHECVPGGRCPVAGKKQRRDSHDGERGKQLTQNEGFVAGSFGRTREHVRMKESRDLPGEAQHQTQTQYSTQRDSRSKAARTASMRKQYNPVLSEP